MEIEKGRVVKAKAGRDKGGYFVVIDYDGEYAMICDGKRRLIEKPKRKKYKHLSVTKTILKTDSIITNRKIKKALSEFIGYDE